MYGLLSGVCISIEAQWCGAYAHMDMHIRTWVLRLWTSVRLHTGCQLQVHHLPKGTGASTEAAVTGNRKGVIAERHARSTGSLGCIEVDHPFEGTMTCAEEPSNKRGE